MARRCEFIGKRFLSGNTVSHSKRHMKRKFLPNLHTRRFYSEVFGRTFAFKVSNAAARTVIFKNGLDNFLLGHNNSKASDRFSLRVLRLYKRLKKKVAKYNSANVAKNVDNNQKNEAEQVV